MFRTGCEQPYVCEECGTDFTPVWRAIGTNEEDLHLFCENCVKASQKRKMRQEHTALLRKELERVMEKEQVRVIFVPFSYCVVLIV